MHQKFVFHRNTVERGSAHKNKYLKDIIFKNPCYFQGHVQKIDTQLLALSLREAKSKHHFQTLLNRPHHKRGIQMRFSHAYGRVARLKFCHAQQCMFSLYMYAVFQLLGMLLDQLALNTCKPDLLLLVSFCSFNKTVRILISVSLAGTQFLFKLSN